MAGAGVAAERGRHPRLSHLPRSRDGGAVRHAQAASRQPPRDASRPAGDAPMVGPHGGHHGGRAGQPPARMASPADVPSALRLRDPGYRTMADDYGLGVASPITTDRRL